MNDNNDLAKTIFQAGIDRKDHEYTSLILGVSKDKFHLFIEFVKMVEDNTRGIVEKTIPVVQEGVKTEVQPQFNPKRNYVKNDIGNFSSKEEMIEALKEFASQKDEYGNYIPYSQFAREHNIAYHNINNTVSYLGLRSKYPRKPGRSSEAAMKEKLGNFSSTDELDNALIAYSKKTDKYGFGYSYRFFAEKHGLSVCFINSRAQAKGYNKLVPRKKGNLSIPYSI